MTRSLPRIDLSHPRHMLGGPRAIELWAQSALLLLGVGAMGASIWLLDYTATAMVLATMGGCFLTLGAVAQISSYHKASQMARNAGLSGEVLHMLMADTSPMVVARKDGSLVHFNPAAHQMFADGQVMPADLAQCLSQFAASPASVVTRLLARVQSAGSAVDELSTRDGALRLSVQPAAALGLYIWRIEPLAPQSGLGADSLSLPMLTANKAGVILFCNAAARAVLGLRPKTLRDIAPPELWRPGEEMQINLASGVCTVMMVELPSTGERREIYLLPMPTDAKRSQPRIADFETLPVALMSFDPSGAMKAANMAARDILGNLAQGTPYFHDLFDTLGRPVSDWLADVAEARLPADAQVLRLNIAASERSHFVHVSLRRMVENARPSVLAVIQDANALKTLEAQFTQSQKMQAIGQLAGGVAHDFNNLLTAISGNCDLLLLRHMGDDPSYPDLLQIRQNANRAAALVAQLLAFSRKQTLQPEYLDMQDLFSDLSHLLNRLVGEKVRLTVQHDAPLGTIRADRRQLEQVIVNLAVNARDAMPKATGGTISIYTEAANLQHDMHRDSAIVPAGDYAKISVCDTGAGIAPDLLPQIFEPFFTTKKAGEGTGLGLSTAYGIVKQSGGFIFVDSTLGQGTTFTLYFPIHTCPADTAPNPAPAAKTPPAVMRQGDGVVLLVEDEAPVRAFAARALRLRGYTVLEAGTGEEALRLLQSNAMQVDLFISDVIMPGLDGPTWVREAQASHPKVPVIFVSGYAEDVMAEHQQRITNSTFLPKPFSLADLTLAVQDKLQHMPGDAAPAEHLQKTSTTAQKARPKAKTKTPA